MKWIYGRYEVEDITKPDGSGNGFRSSVIDAKREYGFIANTDIPIKPYANKRLEDLGIWTLIDSNLVYYSL